jgi:hypothetical protein
VKKGFGANIDNLPKAGLGQGFAILDFGLRKKWGEEEERRKAYGSRRKVWEKQNVALFEFNRFVLVLVLDPLPNRLLQFYFSMRNGIGGDVELGPAVVLNERDYVAAIDAEVGREWTEL